MLLISVVSIQAVPPKKELRKKQYATDDITSLYLTKEQQISKAFENNDLWQLDICGVDEFDDATKTLINEAIKNEENTSVKMLLEKNVLTITGWDENKITTLHHKIYANSECIVGQFLVTTRGEFKETDGVTWKFYEPGKYKLGDSENQ